MYSPTGPYTADLRTLVQTTVPGMVFGTGDLKWAVYGPFGYLAHSLYAPSALASMQAYLYLAVKLQIAQRRSYSCTLGPKVGLGIAYIL